MKTYMTFKITFYTTTPRENIALIQQLIQKHCINVILSLRERERERVCYSNLTEHAN
jgi:hypothetical protein